MTSVNSDYAAAGASTTSSAKSTAAVNSSTNLGKDEFLKILMTQVQNQDRSIRLMTKNSSARWRHFLHWSK